MLYSSPPPETVKNQQQKKKGSSSMKKSAIILAAVTIIAITVGMTISAFLLSRFMLKIQHATERSIKVKGVAEKLITSDLAAFTCSVSIKAPTQAEGYATLEKAAKLLSHKLDQLGFTENMREDKDISCNTMTRTVKTIIKGKETINTYFDHYRLTYSLRVRTGNVHLVAKNIFKIYDLAAKKLEVTVSTPQYYISNPEQYKLELVDQATASAAERARTAAGKSGSKLGALMTARQGVIQITSPASNDTSDYGVYNTSSLQKVMRLVMTLEFELE